MTKKNGIKHFFHIWIFKSGIVDCIALCKLLYVNVSCRALGWELLLQLDFYNEYDIAIAEHKDNDG